ncbi:BTAD domain-containing putative transcriptional regulator [Frondihabitans australicus]|uniref:Putative ATPase n=1 Tax=Frondihabitans australicus TaxID=386892 RepID=A0A495IG72_9MICO|nr:BTAD domain-containing putative transcriptional regulator [Frondihabitans australicus]RKR74066.1 putative ATPase [Frondihabitans australicus]
MSTEVASRVTLAVLGRVRLRAASGDELTEPAGALSKALLVSLALAGSDGVSSARLVDEVWGDTPPGAPRAALQTLVSRTRQSGAAGVIESTPVGYRLGDGVVTDLAVARALLAQATDAADPGEALAACIEALAFWSSSVPGDDLPSGELGDELTAESARLEAALLLASARFRLATGDPGGALADVERLPAGAPMPGDDVLEVRMRALGATGRRAEALRAFAEHREALADELGIDPSARLLRLNTELLRDEPEAEASTSTSPPARRAAPVGRVSGLRRSPNRLLGRDADARAIAERLENGRALTILGAGGLGKTRLATEVGQRLHDADPSLSVAMVELGSVRSADDVPAAIADALGIRDLTVSRLPLGDLPQVRGDVRERILGALDSGPTLLIVDNCEHVVDAAAAWVADLLASAHDLTVLATSRSPLAIAAEHVYPLEPLQAAGAAADLFEDRARQARPGALLPRDVVERLCLRLDGLPLAIELAAARVRSMPVEEIERRLGNRFALLTTGDRSAPERHRTLTAVIDWSWNLLGPSEQRLLRRLAPLPGGFGAEVAARVEECGTEASAGTGSAIDDLDGLVAQSLVSVTDDARTGDLRYRMLETVREFGLERLREAGEGDLVREAITTWARDFATEALSQLTGTQQVRAIATVASEQDNLVAVLRQAAADGLTDVVVVVFAALGYQWTLRGVHEEVGEFARVAVRALLAHPPSAESRDAAMLALSLSGSLTFFGDRRTGLVALGLLRRIRRDGPANDPLVEMTSRLFMAAAFDLPSLKGVLADGIASPNPAVEQLAALVSAQVRENDGDVEQSMELSLRGYELAVAADHVWGRATAAGQIAELHMQRGRPADALEWSRRSRTGLSAVGATADVNRAEWLSGLALVQLGRVDEAREIFTRFSDVDQVDQVTDGEDLTMVSRAGLAEVALADGRIDDGIAAYDASAEALRRGELFSPWRELVAAAALTARVTNGRAAHPDTGRLANRIRVRLLAGDRIPGLFQDVPILGSCVFALGLWLRAVSDDAARRDLGLRLIALGRRTGARQDLGVLVHESHLARITDPGDTAALTRYDDEAAALAPGGALAAAVALLDDRTLRTVAGL